MSVVADWDPPGPPPLEVSVYIGFVHFEECPDDGLNGNSELLLNLVFSSQAGKVSFNKSDDLDLEATNSNWEIERTIQLGYECTPASPVVITYSLLELDYGGKEVLKGILAALARAAALAPLNPQAAAAHALSGIITSSLLPLINGHDDYGSGTVSTSAMAPMPSRGGLYDDYEIDLQGADGEAHLYIRIIHESIKDAGQCDAPPPQGEPTGQPEAIPSGGPPSEEEIARVYQPLQENYWEIWWEMKREGGSGIGRPQFYRIQKTYTHLFLAVAGAVALDMISAARRAGVDVRAAWQRFEQGIRYSQQAITTRDPEARDRNMERALKSFQRAASAAVRAARQAQGQGVGRSLACAPLPGRLGAGLPPVSGQGFVAPRGGLSGLAAQTVGGFELPLFLLLLPDYLAVKTGSAPGIGAFVVGAEAPQVTVAGAPAELGVEVEPLGSPGKFVLRLDTQGLASGSYTLTVTATAQGESTSRELTLVVE